MSMEDLPEYIALSYTWGEPSPARTIILNGEPFQVRQNLWDFMAQARSRALTRKIWIDALCIDQSQISERSHQVSMMDKIYSAAIYVVVWLGCATPPMERILRAIGTNHYGEDRRSELFPPRETGCSKEDFTMAIRNMCERNYWSRVWVVQEFVLARNVVIWCGSQAITERELHWALSKTENRFVTGVTFSNEYLPYCEEWALQTRRILWCRTKVFVSNFRTSLDDSLWYTRSSREYADSRDGLFAILSLVDPYEKELLCLISDYTKSPEEIFQDTWEAMKNYPGVYLAPFTRLQRTERTIEDLAKALRVDQRSCVLQNALDEIISHRNILIKQMVVMWRKGVEVR